MRELIGFRYAKVNHPTLALLLIDKMVKIQVPITHSLLEINLCFFLCLNSQKGLYQENDLIHESQVQPLV